MPRQFSEAARRKLETDILPGFPDRQSALLSTLWLAEEDFGVIDNDGLLCVAEALKLPPAHVYGVFTFYTLFKTPSQGKYVLDVCATLSCALRGAREIVAHIEKRLGIKCGETTPDGMFTLRKVECLADCHHAPMMQVGEDFWGELTPHKVDELLEELRKSTR